MWYSHFSVTWLLLSVAVSGQFRRPSSKPSSNNGLQSVCLGNVLRLTLDKTLAVGSQLEIDAIDGTDIIPLSHTLAAQCGYSIESDPWGTTKVFASLLGCYVDNQADVVFTFGLRLRLYGDGLSEQVEHDVTETCSYSPWASREILCDRNYMEVSSLMVTPETPVKMVAGQQVHDSWENAIPDAAVAPNGIWKMTFHTPDPKVMLLADAQRAGYGAMMTQTRLVIRSPYNMAETYSVEVAGVPMEVFSVSTYYKIGSLIVDSAAACPTGGVVFTEKVITWHVPRRITPLISSAVKILETHMGIYGQRLDKTKMAARHYKLSVTESHVVIEIPVGSPDGYYKSHAPDYAYHITYTVEPMLELLWRAENTQADTRYKVLFPITTPLMPRPPHVIDNTVHEQRVFDILLGIFLHDVELMNITFTTRVLTVAECNARGFDVQEHHFANGSKTFSIRVPFSDELVLKRNPDPLTTVYFLPLVFGLLVLPDQTPFPHPAELEASREDVVLPTITGRCDQENFYFSVKYGSQQDNFQTMMLHAGSWRELDIELANLYSLTGNGTHFSITVPFTAPAAAFELVNFKSIRARVDLLLLEMPNMWQLDDLSLACYFPLTTTECYANGTVTALAVKVESVSNLNPEYLTLRDQSCKPAFSNDRFAFFSFKLNSCGTTRTFFDNVMLYENEIALPYNTGKQSRKGPFTPEYRHTISCYYLLNYTKTMAFRASPRSTNPVADPGVGHLVVQIRLSQDSSYALFYQSEDYPVEKYLRQPLYFEVELMQSTDPKIEVVLENCWATLHKDRTSLPSWDLIIDSCENPDDLYLTVFHPVVAYTRIQVPAHIKRFSIKMFTFTKDDAVLKEQLFVHCDAVLCDTTKPDGICSGQCPNALSYANSLRPTGSKRGLRAADASQYKTQISSGPVLLSDSNLF
uniref:Zona pellucida protein AX 1 n=1 Tax=Oncorhynchus tshawytscha TaxID=74940 RepID=A0A8C8CRL1_ONCTS